MLLMNSNDPTFMVSTTKPHGLPSKDNDYIHQNLISHPFSLNLLSSLNNPSKNASDSMVVSYAKPTISQNDHTFCMLPYIAIEEDEQLKINNGNSWFGVQVAVAGSGGDGYGDGGRIVGGGSDPDYHESDDMDVYYQSMIEANPKNSLILSNYARYLKEVRGDFTKSMEYCRRSIFVDPSDGNVLSMYADLIWSTKNDAESAEIYFEQAIKTCPHDCHVMASYAGFLWDVE